MINVPGNLDAALLVRQRSILACIGRQLVHGKADRLCGGRRNLEWWPGDRDALVDQISEVCELGSYEVVQHDALSLALDQEVLGGGQGLNAFAETLDEIFR